jgi:Zn-dependent protease with chaperone function
MMKRGIRWFASHPPGIDHLDPDQRFMGYPMVMARRDGLLSRLRRWVGMEEAPAEARGFLFRRRIEIGRAFFRLTGPVQQAILLHEAAHLKRHHIEKRALLAPLHFLPFVRRMAWQHELDADAFAVASGYGVPLLLYLAAAHRGDGEFYPPFSQRAQNIHRLTREAHHDQKAA